LHVWRILPDGVARYQDSRFLLPVRLLQVNLSNYHRDSGPSAAAVKLRPVNRMAPTASLANVPTNF